MNHRTHSGSTVVSNANSNASPPFRGPTHGKSKLQHPLVTRRATKPTDFDAIQSIPFDCEDQSSAEAAAVSTVFKKLSTYFSSAPKTLSDSPSEQSSSKISRRSAAFDDHDLGAARSSSPAKSPSCNGDNNAARSKQCITDCDTGKHDSAAPPAAAEGVHAIASLSSRNVRRQNTISSSASAVKMASGDKRDVDKCDAIYDNSNSRNHNNHNSNRSDNVLKIIIDKVDFEVNERAPNAVPLTRPSKRAQKADAAAASLPSSAVAAVAAGESFTLPRVTLRQR